MKANLQNKLGRRAAMLFVTLMAVTATLWAQTQPATGDGTADNPYLISNAQELLWFQQHVNTGTERVNAAACAKLTADIDLSAICGEGIGSWTSIANAAAGYTYQSGYTGTFDGDRHTITGLYSNKYTDPAFLQYLGVNGTVKNLTVNGQMLTDQIYSAIIVSYSKGTISGCVSEGIVKGGPFTGGIVGIASGKIEHCVNRAVITGTGENVGGIAGSSAACSILYCRNEGAVTGKNKTGGIAGILDSGTQIENCMNTAAITGVGYVGGIGGYYRFNSVSNCYSTGNVTATSATDTPASVGAIFGSNNNRTITNCYYPDTITLTKDGEPATLVGVGDGKKEEGTTVKTAAQFASGEVAFLLGNEAWGQVIGTDSSPVFLLADNSNKVYSYTHNEKTLYTNNAELSGTEVPHDYGTTGICSLCGELQPATLNEGVYEIGNAGQMKWFAGFVNEGTERVNAGACAKLTADIDLSPVCGKSIGNWTPIASKEAGYSASAGYTGTFDGDGHTLSGLFIDNGTKRYNALFYYLGKTGTVKNLTVNADITGEYYCAAIVADSYGTISRCISEGSITVTGYSGGIVGNSEGTVEYCINRATITSTYTECIGGITGNSSGTVRYCRNEGAVTNEGTNKNNTATGGIAGSGERVCNISHCANLADITGKGEVGGIIGRAWSATVTGCYSTGNVTATSATDAPASVGAIAGSNPNNNNISNCYYPDTVTLTKDGEPATLVGVGDGIKEEGTTVKTAAQFASGEVAYLLGNDVWGQVIGTDPSPVFLTDNNAVYKIDFMVKEAVVHTDYANRGEYTPTFVPEGCKAAQWATSIDGMPIETIDVTADLTLYFLGDPTGIHRPESGETVPALTYIYSVDGRLVKTVPASEYADRMNGLDKGIYIVNGQKEAVK